MPTKDSQQVPDPSPATRRGSAGTPHDAERPAGNDNQGVDEPSTSTVPGQAASSRPSVPQNTDLTEADLDEVVKFSTRRKKSRKAPKMHPEPASGKIKLPTTIDRIRFTTAFGTTDTDFASLMYSGLMEGARQHDTEDPLHGKDTNRLLAAVNGIGAEDEVEGMLATQMVATHSAAMTALGRLNDCVTLPQQDSYGNLAVKLLRTYTAQMEALNRHRGKGQPSVNVEQVNVNSGGQAIVGAIATSGTVQKPEAQTHEPPGITYEPGTPMRSPDTEREAVPVARGAGKAALPNARRG